MTVILPYYNREDTLGEAIESVLEQTHRELTLILVDDGSSDGSRAIAHSYPDSRVQNFDNDLNSGVCEARNQGLSHAASPLVAFMDSDDKWLPHKLEVQVTALRDIQQSGENVSVLGCGWKYIGSLETNRRFGADPSSRMNMFRNSPGTGTPMLLVDYDSAHPDARFDTKFSALVERDYILSCLANGSSCAVLPDVLVDVRRGRADHVANPRNAARAWVRYLEKYALELSRDPELLSWYHFRAGREFLVGRELRQAWKHFRPGTRHHRFRRSAHFAAGYVFGAKGFAAAQELLPL